MAEFSWIGNRYEHYDEAAFKSMTLGELIDELQGKGRIGKIQVPSIEATQLVTNHSLVIDLSATKSPLLLGHIQRAPSMISPGSSHYNLNILASVACVTCRINSTNPTNEVGSKSGAVTCSAVN